MTGSIYKTERGRWRAQYTDPTGRRRSRTFSSRSDARAWLTSMTRSIDDGRWVGPSDLTLGRWIPEFLSAYRAHAADATKASYTDTLRRLERNTPELLQLPVQSIRQPDVQRMVNTLARTYHARTVEIALTLVRMSLSKAQELHLIAANPCQGVTIPKPTQSHGGRLVPPDVMQRLLDDFRRTNNIRSQASRDVLLLIAVTGMRTQEARSLRCEDVRDDGVMIDSVLDRHGNRKPPKTAASRRFVPLPDDVQAMLARRVTESINGMIFERPDGSLVTPRAVWQYLNRLTNGQVSPHDLRHTFVTNAVRAGANLKALAAITGDNVDTLLKIYTHVSNEDKLTVLELAQPSQKVLPFPEAK